MTNQNGNLKGEAGPLLDKMIVHFLDFRSTVEPENFFQKKDLSIMVK